ncbi:LysR family transcriptional regulator [Paenirhodobacter sp.]|uniref:LysR family transcriptional regulator n=1 Tax=Paenirhodobacter sp. TaxID=1965326 RepID=UPI003B50A661
MARNLDLTALRAVVTVAETGSVTRAAQVLNLTQSAVSMQIRRLEEMLGQQMFTRSQRRMTLSPAGDRLVDYGRRMLRLNDEALCSVGAEEGIQNLRIGVPHDIVAPQIPAILRLMTLGWPRLRIVLTVSNTAQLLVAHAEGALDMILTTEPRPGPQGEVLALRRLVWLGVPGLQARTDQPLRVALARACGFRPVALAALDAAGYIPEDAVEGDSDTVIEATVAAGIAVTARIEGVAIAGCEELGAASGLPELGHTAICFYDRTELSGEAIEALRKEIRLAYGMVDA